MNSFRARAAGANVVAGTGSSLLKELNFAEDSELQALNVQHGYDVRAAESKTRSNFAKYQADRISPETQAGISLLSSASSVATSYGTKGAGAGTQTGGGLNVDSPGIVPTRVSSSELHSMQRVSASLSSRPSSVKTWRSCLVTSSSRMRIARTTPVWMTRRFVRSRSRVRRTRSSAAASRTSSESSIRAWYDAS